MSTSRFMLLVFIAAATSLLTGTDAHAACVPKERNTLLALKQGIGGGDDPYGALSDWHPEVQHDCCQWTGVKCSNLTGHVVELRLGEYGLGLRGEVPNVLGDLTFLQVLDLSFNNNNLSMMTVNLENLCNLTVLNLGLSLSHGNITELINRLPQCSSNKLQELYLFVNNLVGLLPDFMPHLTSLVVLDLTGNNITGPLPAFIQHFASLSTLDLSGNHITGHVPSEIGLLANLTRLDLSANEFDGPITEQHLHGLQRLTYIDLSRNQLKIVVDSEWLPNFSLEEAYFASCQLGPQFPEWLKGQVDINRLDISSAGITDRLPDWFCNTFSKVVFLEISNNQISGGLPTNMDIMPLEALYFSSNNLTGKIPLLPKNLTILDVSRNSLSGPLPSKFGAPKLDMIILHSNYVTGQVPTSICELSLYALDLANNLLYGQLPQCLDMTEMTDLFLRNNSFSGNFPQFLRSGTRLAFLDLSWNRFSGTLPVWIGNISSLQFLRLDHNMFYGHIPNTITNLTNLYHLNLASNWISGVIPPHMSNLTFMTRVYIQVPGTVPAGFFNIVGDLLIVTKRQQLDYQGTGVLEMLSMDLSSNYLTGKIPKEIISLGGLVNLNLSRNHLNGEIPDKIGAMHSLESLDLSNNNLHREIPSSMSGLTYLSTLDLSNNNLTGRIPSGGQLDTLYMQNPSMYDGNTGLCGLPLQRNCSSNHTSKSGDVKRDEHHPELLSFNFGLGIGYLVGLWVVFCTFIFQNTWRISCFAYTTSFMIEVMFLWL